MAAKLLKPMQRNPPHLIMMAGGTGQRCWPVSTSALPKQFHDLLGQGSSLLQATANRFAPIVPPENRWVVTQAQYAEEVKRQLPTLPASQLLCEPVAKNTAACIAYGCYKIKAKFSEAQIIVTPVDHALKEEGRFIAAIKTALAATTESPHLALLAAPCTRPESGYGYIAFEQQEGAAQRVTQFIEKPTQEVAEAFVAQGNYGWNMGIVVGSVAAFVRQYALHLPNLWRAFEQEKSQLNTSEEETVLQALYQPLLPLSFDHAILEKTKDLLVVLCHDAGWADIGSWQTLYDNRKKDKEGNVVQGNVVALATKNCLIRGGEELLIATYGVEELIIVQHEGVVMVCKKEHAQDVKQLVERLGTAL
jgi:mannose-1-phosphate guanylyltransferase